MCTVRQTVQLQRERRHHACVLQELGIAAADVKKLKDASYHVIEAVAHATKRELLQVKGLSEAKVNKIKEAGGSHAVARLSVLASSAEATSMQHRTCSMRRAHLLLSGKQVLALRLLPGSCSRQELLHGLRDGDGDCAAAA